jgi:hypothetical protein
MALTPTVYVTPSDPLLCTCCLFHDSFCYPEIESYIVLMQVGFVVTAPWIDGVPCFSVESLSASDDTFDL